MKNPPLLFLDVETLGLDIAAPVWELGAIQVDTDGRAVGELDITIAHDPGNWVATLPPSFQDNYENRYHPDGAASPILAMRKLAIMVEPGTIVMGSNPSFDTARIERLVAQLGLPDPLWHYHPMDIPTLAHGWLCGKGIFPAPPWKSDFISQACGVDVRDFDRHTAFGDAQWCLALYRKATETWTRS